MKVRLFKYIVYFLVSLILMDNLLFAFTSNTQSQDSTIRSDFIFFPKEIPEWKLITYLGLNVAYLPKIIVEEEMNQSPLVDANFRLGLPYNFSLIARISSIVITNQFLIGGMWSQSFGRFSFAPGFSYAYWLGRFNTKSFDVLANGTMNYPNITFGWNFEDFYVAMKVEAMISSFEETYVGDKFVGGNKTELEGWAFTYTLEQPFWKNIQIMQGVRLNLTKFFFQSWLAFTRTDKYIIFPEFMIGFRL